MMPLDRHALAAAVADFAAKVLLDPADIANPKSVPSLIRTGSGIYKRVALATEEDVLENAALTALDLLRWLLDDDYQDEVQTFDEDASEPDFLSAYVLLTYARSGMLPDVIAGVLRGGDDAA
jgi:hypothetical protein